MENIERCQLNSVQPPAAMGQSIGASRWPAATDDERWTVSGEDFSESGFERIFSGTQRGPESR